MMHEQGRHLHTAAATQSSKQCPWESWGHSPTGAQAPLTGPHTPVDWQTVFGVPVNAVLHFPVHVVPAVLVFAQAKVPLGGLAGGVMHTARHEPLTGPHTPVDWQTVFGDPL